MALVSSADNNVRKPLKAASINGHVDFFFLLLLYHGVTVDTTGNEGRIPLRAAAGNGLLEMNRQLLSNGCNVHIARECDLTAQLAAADSAVTKWKFSVNS